MKTGTIKITWKSLSECIAKRERAQAEIDRLTQSAERLTHFGQYCLKKSKEDREILDGYIKTMKEHGRDYIYLRTPFGVLDYEIGDQLFA